MRQRVLVAWIGSAGLVALQIASCTLNTHGELAEPLGRGGSDASAGGAQPLPDGAVPETGAGGASGAGGSTGGSGGSTGGSGGSTGGSGGSTGGSGGSTGGSGGSGGMAGVGGASGEGGSPPAGGAGGTAGQGGVAGAGGAPTCTADHACVPQITGGVFVRAQAGVATCGGDYSGPLSYGSGVDPGCAVCTCGPAAIGTCTAQKLYGYSDNKCKDVLGSVSGEWCYGFGNTTHRSFRLEPSIASVTTCAPSNGSPNALEQTTICKLTAAPTHTCGSSGVCVPKAPGDLCVLLPAGSNCPTGYAPPKPLAAITGDTRNCTCHCGPSTGQHCNATATVYTGNNCTTGATTPVVADTNTCVDTVDTANGRIYFEEGTWTGGTCTPKETTGSVTFGAAEVLCCLPPQT